MSAPLPTAGALALTERKRIFDSAWFLIVATIVASLTLPWLMRAAEIDLSRVLWAISAFSAFYFVAARAADRLSGGALSNAMSALQILGFLNLGFVWYLVGGMNNPVFLIVFLLPIAAAALMSRRWHPYASALVAIGVAAGAAVASSPGLRWHLARMEAPIPGIEAPIWNAIPPSPTPFAGYAPEPQHSLAALLLFAIVAIAMALVSESVATLMSRLYQRIGTSSRALQDAETLSQKVLDRSPDPAVLVYARDGSVLDASESFFQQFLLDRSDLEGKTLAELIDFAFPDAVNALLQGGQVPFAVHRVGAETRVARMKSYVIEHAGDGYAYITFFDMTDLYYLKSALDSVDEAYLLVGSEGRLEYFNHPAETLFGNLYPGIEAAQALCGAEPAGWWRLGINTRQRRRVTLGGHNFDAALSAAKIPGSGRLTVARLRAEETAA